MKSDVRKFISRGGTKRFAKSTISIVLSLLMVVGVFATLPLTVGAIEKGGELDDDGAVRPYDVDVIMRFWDEDTGEFITNNMDIIDATLTVYNPGQGTYKDFNFGTLLSSAESEGFVHKSVAMPLTVDGTNATFHGKYASLGNNVLNVESDRIKYGFRGDRSYSCIGFYTSVSKIWNGNENYFRSLPKALDNVDDFLAEGISSTTRSVVMDFEIPRTYTVNFHTNNVKTNTDSIYSKAKVMDGDRIAPIIDYSMRFDVYGINQIAGQTVKAYSLAPDHNDFYDTYSSDGLEDPYKYLRPDIGNDYIFKGWFYDEDNDDDSHPVVFESDVVTKDTDIYAHWDAVVDITKDSSDKNDIDGYKSHELSGVQIRKQQRDMNTNTDKSEGLRFVGAVGNDLLEYFDSLSDKTITADDGSINNIEYGFVVTKTSNITNWLNFAGDNVQDYKLEYNSTNTNGVDTTIANTKDYQGFVTNVDCTSDDYSTRKIKDHRKFKDYRLFTMVVNYDNDEADKNVDICARAYIRYYDANGRIRVYYNDYDGTSTYGGCSISYNAVSNMA